VKTGVMTCIVGITDGRTVTIGGDSAGSDGWHVAVEAVRECLSTGGYARTENGREQGGQFLVGRRLGQDRSSHRGFEWHC
jgi:hypothetical protein